MTISPAPTTLPWGFNSRFQFRLSQWERGAGIKPAEELRTPADRDRQYIALKSIIGNTPVLAHSSPNGALILAKTEFTNPSESHYDRAYLALIERLESEGAIQPGDELRDITSGSSGNSLAWLANRLGYKLHLLAPSTLPYGRVVEMEQLGATVSRVEGYMLETSHAQRADIRALVSSRSIRKQRGVGFDSVFNGTDNGKRFCYLNHSEQDVVPEAFEAVGHEVRGVIPPGVHIDYFISVLGNGTATFGISKGLRAWNPNITVIGAESTTDPVQYQAKYPDRTIDDSGNGQRLFGGSAAGVPLKYMKPELLDEIRVVDPASIHERMTRENRGRPAGDTIGASSAMSLVIAEDVAKDHPGSTILVVFHDHADRYAAEQPPLTQADITNEQLRRRSPGWTQMTAVRPIDLPGSLSDNSAGGLVVRNLPSLLLASN